MINKRLFNMGEKNKNHVYGVVICLWLSMILNTALVFRLGWQVEQMYKGNFDKRALLITMGIFLVVIVARVYLKKLSARQSFLAATGIKTKLRKQIYSKLLELGTSYTDTLSTAEVVQVSTEGVDQLEIYYGNYLPQFFYCMLAPITLFAILAPLHFLAALVLFICVPLIPISIIIVQKIAKKLFSKYWGLYTSLGDGFLENVQGMTTLKIYEADEAYHKNMNENAEHFRKITMKVLGMQLRSIIAMDTVAYGGTALGAIFAISGVAGGKLSLSGAVVIILLASEFFLPMRTLGSYFHIAMNGMSAADKIFGILDMEMPDDGDKELKKGALCLKFDNVYFSYTPKLPLLQGISFTAKRGLTALVGVSGCGKSTIADLVCANIRNYEGGITIEGIERNQIKRSSLQNNVTLATDKGYIFAGTIRENLLLAKENATEEEMINVLKKVEIWDFLSEQKGLDTNLTERGSNFSGGQRQRVNIARALLRDSQIYILDEVTSNIDAESEEAIMKVVQEMAKTKTVILISHRLANVVPADEILFLKNGHICERGTHNHLLMQQGEYSKLFLEQQTLEQYGKGRIGA